MLKFHLYSDRVGFAGETGPRSIVRTEVRCPKSGQIRKCFDATKAEEQYDLLVEFIHNLYFRSVPFLCDATLCL